MLKVVYGPFVNNFKPIIKVVFNYHGFKMTFYPDILCESDKWSELLVAVENNTDYNFFKKVPNREYTIAYENDTLDFSIVKYGSEFTEESCVSNEITVEMKQTLIELENISKCVKNNISYFPQLAHAG